MSQLVETTFRCGDGEALMAYVYGESSPAEHDAITAHVARCAACAEEIAALGSTREQLAAWAPPPQTLGFQITRSGAPLAPISEPEAEPAAAKVLRPAAWWNRPLPAWAQMAAAAVIFVSGLAIGMSRNAAPPATVARDVAPAAVLPAAAPASVTREELARLEQRLKGEIAQVRVVAPAAAGPAAATLQRVSQMIAESERRQQQELNFRTSQIVTDLADRRKVDMYNIERRLGATTVRVQSNQQDINSLAQRVGFIPANSPYVP